MRIEDRDIKLGVLAGTSLLLLEALVCRVADKRLFAYPWLQGGSSLAAAAAVILIRSQLNVAPPESMENHQLKHAFYGEDHPLRMDLRMELYRRTRLIGEGQLAFDLAYRDCTAPHVQERLKRFHKICRAQDGLPILYLDDGNARAFISWLWQERSVSDDHWPALDEEIRTSKRGALADRQRDARDALFLYYCDSLESLEDVQLSQYAAYFICTGNLLKTWGKEPAIQDSLTQEFLGQVEKYWEIPVNRPLLASRIAEAIANFGIAVDFDRFIGMVNAIDERNWTEHQDKLKLRLGTLKRVMAPRKKKGPKGWSRDMRILVWSWLSANDRAAVGYTCKLWCADVQSMLWAENVGISSESWVQKIEVADCPRLKDELVEILKSSAEVQ